MRGLLVRTNSTGGLELNQVEDPVYQKNLAYHGSNFVKYFRINYGVRRAIVYKCFKFTALSFVAINQLHHVK